MKGFLLNKLIIPIISIILFIQCSMTYYNTIMIFPDTLIWLNDSLFLIQADPKEIYPYTRDEYIANINSGASRKTDSVFPERKSYGALDRSVVSPDGNMIWGVNAYEQLSCYNFVTEHFEMYDIIIEGYIDIDWESRNILAMNDYSLLSLINMDNGVLCQIQKGDTIDNENIISQFNSVRLVKKNGTKKWSVNINYLNIVTGDILKGILMFNNELSLDSCQFLENIQGIFSPNCKYIANPIEEVGNNSVLIYDSSAIELEEIKI